jgi:hypothetical protein
MIAAAAPTFTYRPPLVGSRRVHRRALVFIAALAGLTAGSIAGGTPAIADPGHPTNYESTVVDVEPRSDGVRFSVAGGDAYLTVSVEPGHTVEIPGYFNEPYIRIDADQSVYVNENSEAFFINGDRYGRSEIPGYVKGSEPSWALVGTDGFYAWHDHRAHWMSLDLPPTVTGAQRQQVFPWSVPTVVNGMTTTVSGELVWVPSRNAIPAILAGMAALLPLLLWASLPPGSPPPDSSPSRSPPSPTQEHRGITGSSR